MLARRSGSRLARSTHRRCMRSRGRSKLRIWQCCSDVGKWPLEISGVVQSCAERTRGGMLRRHPDRCTQGLAQKPRDANYRPDQGLPARAPQTRGIAPSRASQLQVGNLELASWVWGDSWILLQARRPQHHKARHHVKSVFSCDI